MTPSSSSAASPMSPLTTILAFACLALAVALPLLTLHGSWAWPPEAWLARVGVQAPLSIAPWQTGLAMFLGLLPVSALSYGLLRVRLCLQGFLRGEIFGLATVRHLRGFAAAAFTSAGLGMATPLLISVVLTWSAPAGQRAMALNIGSNDLLMALVAGIVWQIASVFTRAIELAEDHAQIV